MGVKPEEIEYPVSVEKGPVTVEATDKVDQDQPKSQKIKSQKLPKKEKSLEVNQASTTKLETATNLEEEQPPKDKTKIKQKSVKDKKTSLEVKNIEESETTIPIVTDETRKIHISVEPWNKVDEPVTPELAPGVTVQDNQAKASATSTGTTIEEIPAVTEKADSIPEKPKKKPTKIKDPVQEKDAVEPVGGFKLKKAQTGKRQIEEAEVEKITLKRHEFEQVPHEEEPEKETGVILSNPIITEKVDSIPEKPKKKPKKIKEPIQEKDAVEPELAPGVTVQDNQAKASATSTGTTIEEIPAVTEKVDSIPEKPK